MLYFAQLRRCRTFGRERGSDEHFVDADEPATSHEMVPELRLAVSLRRSSASFVPRSSRKKRVIHANVAKDQLDSASVAMSVAEELQKLSQLRDSGVLTEQEFAIAKAELLKKVAAQQGMPGLETISTNQWAVLLHLSQFAGFVVPIAGFVAPILIWQMKKQDDPILDLHGKNIANWLISSLIYGFVSGILIFVVIGLLGLLVLIVLGVVFPIIGAIKANNGEVWEYPLAIRFFR